MTVFANGLEISAKAQGCKIIAAFPDPCFTPPQTPATPPGVPLPYPNFGTDGDLTSGTGTVKIGNKEVSQENSSKYSKVSGDEAGCAPKKGVVTSKNTGKAYAQKWSMDVKAEGKGLVRLSDIATTNHMEDPGNDAPWVIVGKPGGPGFSDTPDCLVGSYDEIATKCNDRGGEAHHIIPDEYIRTGTRENSTPSDPSFPTIGNACAICVGGQASGKKMSQRKSDRGKKIAAKGKASGLADARGHGYMHYFFDAAFGNDPRPVGEAVTTARQALVNVAKYNGSLVSSDCAKMGEECIEKQFEEACKKDPQPNCEGNVRKSKERFENMRQRLNEEGHLTPDLMPTMHSSLT